MGVLQKFRVPAAPRWVRWTAAAVAGAAWWSAVLRLAVQPTEAGPVMGALAAGGWGLSLIPLHAVPRSSPPCRSHLSLLLPEPRTRSSRADDERPACDTRARTSPDDGEGRGVGRVAGGQGGHRPVDPARGGRPYE